MKGKKRTYIYLAGNISGDDRTYLWREEFTKLLYGSVENGHVVIVDPCANPFNQKIRNYSNSGNEFVKEARKRSQRILRAKDYQLVKMCNLVVVNLHLVASTKPMIGTVQELAWANDIFYIPVIGITGKPDEWDDLSQVYINHPWIDECCSAKVETVEEAANTVKEFFLHY